MKIIKQLAKDIFSNVVNYRRHIHANPELSGNESKTADFVCSVLDRYMIKYKKNISKHGVVAIIDGGLPGNKCVALRADMDALPITESNNVSYSSKNKGVMHACGHDAHVASLLGSLIILNQLKNRFSGKVKAIFQPSEEEYNGGAKFMIEDGVLENPDVTVIFGQHVSPELKTGQIGICKGAFMASTDEINISICGNGGHAAIVDDSENPVWAAAFLLNSIKNFKKKIAKKEPEFVLNFGKITANGSCNVIPADVCISGTLRTFDENLRQQILSDIQKITKKTSDTYHCNCDINIKEGYPVLVNDEITTERVSNYIKSYIGENNLIELPKRYTAEDFAYFLQQKKGTFYRLGVGFVNNDKTIKTHSPAFDIDESALELSVGIMSYIAISELNSN